MPGGAWLSACTRQLQLELPSVWCWLEGSSLVLKMSKEPEAPQTSQVPTTVPIHRVLGGDFGGRGGAAAPGVATMCGTTCRVTPGAGDAIRYPHLPPTLAGANTAALREKQRVKRSTLVLKLQEVFAKSRGTSPNRGERTLHLAQPNTGTMQAH